MTSVNSIRLILGLPASTVSDEVIAQAIVLAQEYCDAKAAGYNVSAPESAVASMTIYYLRTHLDLAGIKPSSISLPDISMSTDFRSAAELLKDDALSAIKSAAFAKGSAVRHIRSGRVGRW